METLTGTLDHPVGDALPLAPQPALVIAWSRHEPQRVGEVFLLPARGAARLGREGGAGALCPVRIRPGATVQQPPLSSPRLSREQLQLTRQGGQILVENIGRRALLSGAGEPSTALLLAPGDVLEVEHELVLLCASVPARLEPFPAALHAFGEPDPTGLVGEGAAAWLVRRRLLFLAERSGHVLLWGESGTGKELLARGLHALGTHTGPLVSRNAATLPEGLIDAELFGNARSYPNPGMPERPGLVGAADGGVLFLDELGELPLASQAHLLRVLDSGEYQRLGESRTRSARLRLVGATNRDPEQIKHDLLARFPFRLDLPGLNARREDIPLLLQHLLRQAAQDDPALARFFPDGLAAPPRIDSALIRALLQHTYRTHVRELAQQMWRAVMDSPGNVLSGSVLPPEALVPPTASADAADAPTWQAWIGAEPGDIPPEQVQACLDDHHGYQEPTWRALGLSSRHVLSRLIRRHSLRVRKGD